MARTQINHRQHGFFSIGIGLALAALFSGTAAGIAAVENSDETAIVTTEASTAPTGDETSFAYVDSQH